jgi:hypothetical protein
MTRTRTKNKALPRPGPKNKILLMSELRIVVNFCMIFIEIWYKSHQSRRNSKDIAEKIDIRQLN